MHSYSFTNDSKGSLTFKDPLGIQHTLRRKDKFVIEVTSAAPIDTKIALQKAKKIFVDRSEMLVVLRSAFNLPSMTSATYSVLSAVPKVEVPEVKVDSKLIIGEFSPIMRVHTTQKLDVQLEPKSNERIYFKSSSSRKLKVDDEGLLTSFGKEGDVVVTITSGDVSTDINIQVISAELQEEINCIDEGYLAEE